MSINEKTTPNYRRFDFAKFVDSVIDLDFLTMAGAFNDECLRVEASMRGRGGPQARADGGAEYVACLKRVLFWFHHNALADKGPQAETCRRIAEMLVKKGQLKPEALDTFLRPDECA
jgi:hypothetical protein